MKPDAKDLFARAHELTGIEREAFLSGACGDDAELRLEVQRLLVQAEKADSFFADDEGATIAAEAFEAPFSEAEGDEIGAYTLRQKIGEGGFGVVWMAEQTGALNRMVALKVVKAGMDTRQVLARFEAERQALAMMDHPNIARILDAGATPTGRPYFAMELVKGIPITEFCREQKLGPRRRLALLQDVCSAINHAHQKGVIHRDLKPSNVMVTLEADRPVVKVIDFGIAKATQNKLTEKTLFTRFEQFLGTPAYMSPEQAAMSNLDIDTRSDIYSLGILLYELLAGTPPFDQKSLLSAGYDEMRRIIKEDEPPKPSVRLTQTQASEAKPGAKAPQIDAAALKGDLDWIVMKAIDKDRTRRYETANAFAADIGRYLDDEPVLAAAPSVAYKFRKFARRHSASLGVAAGFALLLVVATALSSWLAWRATEARDDSRASQAVAETALRESEEARAEAEDAYSFLLETFQSADLSQAEGDREITLVEVLGIAQRKLETEFADHPERRLGLQNALAATYDSLGKYSEALALYENVRDYCNQSGDPAHQAALVALEYLSWAYVLSGRLRQGVEAADEGFRLAREAYGERDPQTLAMWAQRLSIHARAIRNGGLLFGLTQQLQDDAEALVELCREVHGADSPEFVDALHMRAHLSPEGERVSRHDEAVAYAMERLGTEHQKTLSAMWCLSDLFVLQDLSRAIELREKAIAGWQARDGTTPDVIVHMRILVETLQKAGRYQEAVATAERAVNLSRERLGPEHPQTKKAQTKLDALRSGLDRSGFANKVRELSVGFTPTDSSDRGDVLRYAAILAYQDRRAEYASLVETVLPRLRSETDKLTVVMLSKSLYLMAPGEDDLEEAQHEAWEYHQAIDDWLGMEYYIRLDRGLGAYRGGDWDEVEGTLVNNSPPFDYPGLRASAYAIRAMARWNHGRRQDAAGDLELAKKYYERDAPIGFNGPFDHVVYPNLLLGEALELIEGSRDWLPPIPELEPREVLVAPTSEWRWLHPVDAVDPAEADPDFHQTFATADFDDSAWQTGHDSAKPGGGFGYGDEWFTGVEIGLPNVVNGDGELLGKTAYFRHRFTTTQEFSHLELQCQRDDGIIVYLNGEEVARDNMATGQAAHLLPAIETVRTEGERSTCAISLRSVNLPPGEHVLAISVHNTERPSSDLRLGGVTLVGMKVSRE